MIDSFFYVIVYRDTRRQIEMSTTLVINCTSATTIIKTLCCRHPLSSMVFGTNALVTKPAISFAPMLVVSILNRHGYESVKTATAMPPGVTVDLNSTMFNVMCFIPVSIGLLQLIIWSRYTIRNSHLTITKYVET